MAVYTLPKNLHPDFAVKRRKPVSSIEIDRSNELGALVTDYVCPLGDGVVRDLSNGEFFTPYGTAATSPISGGMAMDVSAANSAYENQNPTQNGSELTLFWHGIIASSPNTSDAIIVLTHSSDSSVAPYVVAALKWTTGPKLIWQYNINGTYYSASASLTPELNVPLNLVFTHKSGQQIVYVNGEEFGSSAQAGGAPTYGSGYRFVVGEDYRLASRNSRSKVFSAGVASGIWSASQVRSFNADPYQILKPAVPISYFTAEGGVALEQATRLGLGGFPRPPMGTAAISPVGFEPQWYRNRSAIIGAGMK